MHPCDKPDKGGCQHTCKKSGVEAVCECNTGFKLKTDKKTCDKGEFGYSCRFYT